MRRRRKPSRQAISLFGAMLSGPGTWRHGYDLTRQTGLPSGTLYPLLMRLEDEGLLESEWQPAARPGLPARHAYRLTRAGVAFAHACVDASAERTGERGLAPA